MSTFVELTKIANIDDTQTRQSSLRKWLTGNRKAPPPLSPDEGTSLLQRAKALFEEGDIMSGDKLVRIVAYSTPREEIPHVPVHEVYPIKDEPPTYETLRYENDFLAYTFTEWGIISRDENVVIHDIGRILFGSPNLRRSDILFLTDRRLVCVGYVQGPYFHDKPSCRLLYDNWEELPYLHAYDFLMFDKIERIESKYGWGKKVVEMDYRTKYAEEKGKTLYGPYFFKYDLPKVKTIRDGLLRVEIELDDLPFKGFPKDFRKTRQERIVEHILKHQ